MGYLIQLTAYEKLLFNNKFREALIWLKKQDKLASKKQDHLSLAICLDDKEEIYNAFIHNVYEYITVPIEDIFLSRIDIRYDRVEDHIVYNFWYMDGGREKTYNYISHIVPSEMYDTKGKYLVRKLY